MVRNKMTKKEIQKINEVNDNYVLKKCLCGIHKNKPSFCRKGPTIITRLYECGFCFVDGKRYGNCLNCGKCCAIPRKKGDPYGFYDPDGKKCKHLIVGE